ncbi:MAG: leucine-rich repeat protein [Oscillospiraceae bacterium]|nr:leucine-rich repeat protein [Oscillospiraceae bacterium]
MKLFRRIFALLIAMVLLCGMLPVGTTAHAANTVSFSMEGIFDYELSAELAGRIMDTRQEQAFIFSMKADGDLNDYAMTRAAEIYACATENRPNGEHWKHVLEMPFYIEETVQFYTFAKTVEEAYTNMFDGIPLRDNKYKSIGAGCFSQKGSDIKAWVVFASTAEMETPHQNKGIVSKEVTIDIKPSNLNGVLQHQYFSNAHCACYLIKGTTIGTAMELRNMGNSDVIITPSKINYAYTTTDPSVITFDNNAHTITAKSVGKAELGIAVDGQPINFISTQSSVEVYDTPVLTHEIYSNAIHVYYGDFPVSAMNDITLYCRGTKDELWTKCNIERDSTYDHYITDPTETYTFVVRYWDDYLDDWVIIGEPLVVQLGDAPVVTPEPTPTPTPTPSPAGLWLPTEADLPNRTTEPAAEEVTAEMERIFTDIYPWGTEWHDPNDAYWIKPSYSWQGGADHEEGNGDVAFAMAVSDLVFGKLPARSVLHMSAADLRPGDIIITNHYDCLIVLDATPQYVDAVSTMSINSSGWQEDIVKSLLYPLDVMDSKINYVLTRYASDSPGVDALHPSIVPESAEPVAAKTVSTYINYIYTSAIRWTFTADGTLYLEGYGSPGYGDDGWTVYQDEIKRVVFGNGVTGVLQETFSNYTALEEVVLSDTVDEIRRSTFTNCPNLKSIQFGKGLKSIDENAFKYSGLESLRLPDGLESIGDYAFTSCESLQTLYVPASVTQWGTNVFTSCNALEELTLEEGLTCLGYSAFNHLETLKTASIPGSIKTVPQRAFYFSNLETVILEEGVEVLDEYAFGYCKQLKEIHLPNSLTTVENNVFRDCDNVTDVYFYGTEAEWAEVSIGTSNDCLDGSWWNLTTIHFVDESTCFHKNITVLPAVAPTCTETGLTEGKICADCGELLTPQDAVPILDHDYVEVKRTEATCSTSGSLEFVCTRDRNHRYIKFLAPTGVHSYENGFCTMCGEEEPAVMENPFTDISEADWYFAPVMWAKAEGVTGGKTATTFAPNEGCTRAQVVTFLWAANGKPMPAAMHNPFTDVPNDAWYANAVLWAVEQGITGGTSPDTFSPDATCTRAQIATFLYAAAGKPEVSGKSSFADVADSDWFAKPVIWAKENEVTGGISPTEFGPNQVCTRAQVVTFLYKVYG